MSTQQIAAPASPYKGLAPFEDSSVDALFFFGRDRESEIVAANLLAYRLTVLYGASGVGKSSLLRAGVAYRLREQGEAVIVFSTWSGDPVQGLLAEARETLASSTGDAAFSADGEEGLAASLAGLAGSAHRELYLILDQLDEYFVYHETQDRLAAELAAVTRGDLRVNVLISIRDDMLSRLDRFKALIPNLFSNYLRLDHLDRRAAREAIVGPLDRYNTFVPIEDRVAIEPELVEAVLDQTIAAGAELGEQRSEARAEAVARVEAPYLQLVLQRLWEAERSAGSASLRLETFERLGGSAEIVRAHLVEALEALPPEERDLAAKLFNHLVTPSGTKIAHRVGDLAQYVAVSEREIVPVLDALVDERIVRPVTEPGAADGARYEIFHDVLAEPVVAWRAKHEAERELAWTRADARRRQRRMLVVTIGSLIAVAAMVFVTIFAFAQRREARRQRAGAQARQVQLGIELRRAEAGEFTARASLHLETDPEGSLSDAVHAARLESNAQIEQVLRSGILASPRAILRIGRKPVNDVEFSGRLAIAGGEDGTAVVFRSPGNEIRELDHRAPIKVALLNSKAELAVTAGGRRAPTDVWNLRSGRRRYQLHQQYTVMDASLSRDASRLATGGTHGRVDVWDTRSRERLVSTRVGSPVKSVELNRDGSLLLVVQVHGQVRLLDAASGGVVNTFGRGRFYNEKTQLFEFATQGPVDAATFSPGGELVVTVGHDGSVFVWEVPTDRLPKHFPGTGQPLDVEFSPSGTLFAVGSADNTGAVWNAGRGLVAPLAGHTNPVNHLSFSPDGTLVVTASTDGTARVWKAEKGKTLRVLAGHDGPVTDADFSPDGKFVATTGADGTVRFWDARPDPPLRFVGDLHSRVTAIAIGPDARTLVAGTATRGASLWRIGREDPLSPLDAVGSILAAAYGSEPLVLASRARRSTIWNVAKRRPVAFVRHAHMPTAAAITPDGTVFATARARYVRLWNGSGKSLGVVKSPAIVTAIALSRDGTRVAAGGKNGLVVTWDVRTRNPGFTCKAGRKPLRSVEFDPPGDRVLASSKDSSVRICEAGAGARPPELRWHSAEVRAAAFSADNRWVATAGPRVAGLGRPIPGEPLFRLPGHKRGTLLTAVAWSPAGYRIVTGDTAGEIRTYSCRLCVGDRELLRIAEERLRKLGKR